VRIPYTPVCVCSVFVEILRRTCRTSEKAGCSKRAAARTVGYYGLLARRRKPRRARARGNLLRRACNSLCAPRRRDSHTSACQRCATLRSSFGRFRGILHSGKRAPNDAPVAGYYNNAAVLSRSTFRGELLRGPAERNVHEALKVNDEDGAPRHEERQADPYNRAWPRDSECTFVLFVAASPAAVGAPRVGTAGATGRRGVGPVTRCGAGRRVMHV